MLARIRHGLAGRAAEELVFGHQSTGSASDLASATHRAHEMVCRYGMSELGPIYLEEGGGGEVFLGRDWTSRRNYSEKKAAEIDHEVSRMLRELYADALRRLREHRPLLDRIAEALLERETLDGPRVRLDASIPPVHQHPHDVVLCLHPMLDLRQPGRASYQSCGLITWLKMLPVSCRGPARDLPCI